MKEFQAFIPAVCAAGGQTLAYYACGMVQIMDKSQVEIQNVYGELFRLSLPIVMQNIFSTAVGTADTLMIGMVNQEALAAVSLANQIQFVMNLVFLGLTLGTSLMTAQYWGHEDRKTIEKILGLSFKIGIGISVGFAVTVCVFPRYMMGIFSNEKIIIDYGASYLRIVGISYVFTGISQIYEAVMKAVRQVQRSTIIVSVTLVLNVVFNAWFLFGWFGMPKLGVVGVALGTLLARTLELIWCMMEAFFGKGIPIRISYILTGNRELGRDFWKYALPITANGLVFGSTIAAYSAIMGHLGSDVVAANSVATMARNIAMVGCNGLASGAGIYLGSLLGGRELERAKTDATSIFRVTLLLGAVGGILILFARPFLLEILKLTPRAQNYLSEMLFINAGYVIAKAVNVLISNGINCSGGDTVFGLVCDTVVLWGIMVPLGFIAAFWLKLPPMVVYGILCLDELVKLPFMYQRYKTYRWAKNITK